MSTLIQTDLKGKVKNLKDFKNEALLPLFEAVTNSIDAIEERNTPEGLITIRITRLIQPPLTGNKSKESEGDIIDFEIEDNGSGFNDDNYKSFETSDSTYKEEQGGKGLGHFFWLKAFKKVEIESVYETDKQKFLRKIEFDLDNGTKEKENKLTTKDQKTIVKLKGFKQEYQKLPTAYKLSKTITQRILEHCLSYLIGGLKLNIKIIDGDNVYSVNEEFDEIKQYIFTEKIQIKDTDFLISHVKLYSTYQRMHNIVLTANKRAVIPFDIHKLLGTSLEFDEEGRKFYYCVYVSSSYLDKFVDSSRLEFNLPENRETLDSFDSPITIEEIKNAVVIKSKKYLEGYLDKIGEQKKAKVYEFISKENPALRSVPHYCKEVYNEIELNSTKEKINEILYKHKGRAEYKAKERSQELLKTQAKSISEIEKEYKNLVDELEDYQKDELAGYMIFRKMIIELFDKKLKLKKEGKYNNEDIIHDLIMPRKRTTDQLRPDDYNLWLIDERLTFHEYAASDKSVGDTKTSERSDISVFSEIDPKDRVAKNVSIIEFKKPMRSTFNDDPTQKVLEYVRNVRNKSIKLPDGRPLVTDETTRFYCYIICDITEKIEEFAQNADYAALKGEQGYYKYNQFLHAHIELVSFDKIIIDAKQRHQAFFDKLKIS